MKKFTSLLVFALLMLPTTFYAQKISNIDFDSIKAKIQDENSPSYYPNLIERLKLHDPTLTEDDYTNLYYGNVFYENYDPYAFNKEKSDNEKELNKQMKAGNFKEAIPLALAILDKNPIELEPLTFLMIAYGNLKDKESVRKFIPAYAELIKAIERSGDGKSKETAYVINSVPDEYQLLYFKKLNPISQKLIDARYDVLEVKDENGNVENVYFDVSKPLKKSREYYSK
ncbi:DUF4919 domain-containing protein [Ornithobacterium rhinotracheale]|uniref:DUF4919 domain-containing protein n=1 Tax=Ornithobacterium rhinotracheale TaxID=28251 RepID=UPI003FA406BF